MLIFHCLMFYATAWIDKGGTLSWHRRPSLNPQELQLWTSLAPGQNPPPYPPCRRSPM